jgi:glucose-6-phosphate 1-epimerase
VNITDSLSAAFGKSGRLVFEMSPLGGIVARLGTGGGTAIIALQGAQVLSWTPSRGEQDVLWLSPLAKLGTGKPLRGGIPVCWPWFGSHPDAASGKGAHGFVRAAEWRVIESAITSRETRLTLGYALTPADDAALGGAARLMLDVVLSETLDVSLTTENAGTEPLWVSEALHSYFTVGDIASVELMGLNGRRYLDQLSGATFEQAGSIAIPSETDRVYWDTPDTVVINDTHLKRRISISKSDSASTVVWNPWREKSLRLGDMPDGEFRKMVCIETANVGPLNLVTIRPGKSHTLAARFAVAQLP